MFERKSRFGITKLLSSKDSTLVREVIKQCIINNAKYPFKSITFDNGLEFTKAQELDPYLCKIYYAFPYSPWQRCINENWNGFLRRWFPKGNDFTKISEAELSDATRRINAFERDILNGTSSYELLNHYVKIN